jgi:hypothetical protein
MIAVLDKGYDYVIDAIDTLSPKVFLIWHSLMRKYPVVSSMGSGGKLILYRSVFLIFQKPVAVLWPVCCVRDYTGLV